MILLEGNYFLKVDLGGTNLGIDAQNIKEFTIVQDMKKFLPGMRVQLIDAQGILTHILPFDRAMSRLSVQIGKAIETEEVLYNDFDFMVYRRKPEGQFGTSAHFDVTGLLDMETIFVPTYCRAWKRSIKAVLTDIALNELKCDSVDISQSLDYSLHMLQPQWSNADLFVDLKRILIGNDGEGAFQIFVKRERGRSVFVCKSLKELYAGQVKYKFIVNDNPVQDYLPIVDYEIIDNYKLFGMFGSRRQSFGYYDYYASRFIEGYLEANDFYSLADYHLIDSNDTLDSARVQKVGRSSEFTPDFKNVVKYNFHNRLNDLLKMWVYTWGVPNICPGDVVQVLFGQGQVAGELQSYQYSGYWLVERVVHMFGSSHRMRLLLTRNGIDTDKDTTLLKAARKRK